MSLNAQGVPYTINGDLVIGYTNGRKIKDLGWADMSTLSSWYKEDPNEKHLGLINIYDTMGQRPLPMYKNFFQERAILEVNGFINVKKIFGDAITIFIMPPSFEELERRLRGRKSDDSKIINERLNIAKEEIKYKDKYDYIVINSTVDKAVLEIENIINNC